MKKKDIAEFLDKVADIVGHAHPTLVPVGDADMSDAPTTGELDALRAGIVAGLSLGSMLCEGSYEGRDPKNAAVMLMVVGMEAFAGDYEEGDDD